MARKIGVLLSILTISFALICNGAVIRERNLTRPSPSSEVCYCTFNVFSGFDKAPDCTNTPITECIGGCGGNVISYPRQLGQPITRLKAWQGCGTDHNGLKGIQITYQTGTYMFGNTCGGGVEIIFDVGEYIVGDITISGNGVGTKVGYIQFKTNKGKNFQIGDSGHNHYIFPADGAYLTGIHGRSSADLDQIGFIITEPIDSTDLENMRYPTLGSLKSGLSPAVLFKDTYYNKSPNEIGNQKTVEESTGESKCWKSTFGTTFGMSLTVEAGAPIIGGKVETGFKWEVSTSSEHQSCTNTAKKVGDVKNFVIPGNNNCTVEITQWASPVDNLPFVADFVFNMRSGAHVKQPNVQGSYNGIYISQSSTSVTCTPLNVTSNIRN